MRKRVFMVHRWSGSPSMDWYPWLKKELQAEGFEVFTPSTPHPDEPTIEDSVSNLARAVGEPDEDTYFVGHSIGCQTVMRYLQTVDTRVGGAVFVAPWFNLMNLEDEETEEIAQPWLESPIDTEKIKQIAPRIVTIFSSNDPYVPQGDTELFKERLEAKTITIENAGHFTQESGYSEFPLVRDELINIS